MLVLSAIKQLITLDVRIGEAEIRLEGPSVVDSGNHYGGLSPAASLLRCQPSIAFELPASGLVKYG